MITRVLIVLGALIVLASLNVSILGKERLKRDGQVTYLELAPRDPRSLMQGDYMALRFRLAQDIESTWASGRNEADRDARTAPPTALDAVPHEGESRFASIVLDEQLIAHLAAAKTATRSGRFRYRVRNNAAWLGTNAFFFEEGSEERYRPARYGEFRWDKDSGEAILVGLRDQKLKPL